VPFSGIGTWKPIIVAPYKLDTIDSVYKLEAYSDSYRLLDFLIIVIAWSGDPEVRTGIR